MDWGAYWAALVTQFGIQPDAAWGMTTHEFWMLYRAKHPPGSASTMQGTAPVSREEYEQAVAVMKARREAQEAREREKEQGHG